VLLDELRHHDSKSWRRAVKLGATRGPDALVRYSPPLFGLVFAAALPAHRAAVRRSLRRALGPRNPVREALDVAAVFTAFASCLAETFVVDTARGRALRVSCRDDGLVASALAERRGVILATAHTGGWDVAVRALNRVFSAEVVVVMRRERDPETSMPQDETRQRAGLAVVHVGDDALAALPVLAHLRRGGIVAVQIDRLPQGMRGCKSKLFGEPFSVPEGPLRLASLTGAPILPVFSRRRSFLDYEVDVGAPVRLPPHAREAQHELAATALLHALERFVIANPTQWFHFES
jgi:KDO2-lipid IV(A) lauroyltransferase